MKTWSSFTHPHVIPNLFKFLSYVEHKRRYFEIPNSCWSPLISIGSKILRKSMGTINCLITSILQNTFFYVQHKLETRTGLDMRESKHDQVFIFGWTISLNAKQCVLTNWQKAHLVFCLTDGYTSGVYAMYNLHSLSPEYMNSLLIHIL